MVDQFGLSMPSAETLAASMASFSSSSGGLAENGGPYGWQWDRGIQTALQTINQILLEGATFTDSTRGRTDVSPACVARREDLNNSCFLWSSYRVGTLSTGISYSHTWMIRTPDCTSRRLWVGGELLHSEIG